VGDKHVALVIGKFVDGKLQLIVKHVAKVERLRPASGDGRRSSMCSIWPPSPSTAASLKVSGLFLRRRSMMRLRATRKSQLVTFLCIGGIGHTPPDEIAQQGSLFRDDLGDSTVLLGHPRDPILAGSSIYCRRRTRGSNIVEIRVGGT
jgi:hypothetical protein